MKFFALIGVLTLALALAACGGGSSSGETSDSSSDAAATTKAPAKLLKPKSKPVLAVPKGPPPKQLVIKDLKVGSGAAAEAGDELTVEYTAFNYVNHEEFTNHAHHWGAGEPLEFKLGGGEVIKGVDQGMEGMKAGGRRELIIPSDLGYGNVSPPPEVGPGETVIFVVELLGINGSSPAVSGPDRPKPRPAIPAAPPPRKLVVKDLKRGSGVAAKSGDELTIEYVGYDYRTGKEFDAQTHHWGYGEPAVFELGANEAVPGWDPGLQGMRVGGLRELTVPPRLAYGNGISPDGVRPGDTVVFVFELVGIG